MEKVDLLNPDVEPADEQLECLTRSVMKGVRERASKTDRALSSALTTGQLSRYKGGQIGCSLHLSLKHLFKIAPKR
jgi:hypothetical protein